jgi:ABC-type transporter Mla MlaB component
VPTADDARFADRSGGWDGASRASALGTTSPVPTNEPAPAVDREGGRIRLSGELRTRDAGAIWKALQAASRDVRTSAVIAIDMTAVPAVDGDVMALLVELTREIAARGGQVELTNMTERVAEIAALYAAEGPLTQRKPRRPESAVAQVGAATLAYVGHLQEILGFLGGLVLVAVGGARRPRRGLWSEVVPRPEVALIVTLNRALGVTIVMVTHDLGTVYRIADRCIMLDAKSRSVLAIGDPRYLCDSKDPRIRAFVHPARLPERRKARG